MSHFSFTRLPYDNCAIDKKNQESTSPFHWMTDSSIRESEKACLSGASPLMQNPYNNVPAKVIDISSDLRGQTYNLTKCPEHQYNPNTRKTVDFRWNECTDDKLIPEYTRSNRACNLSGININRFDILDTDVQELAKIHGNNVIGSNTRNQVRDAFTIERDNLVQQYKPTQLNLTPYNDISSLSSFSK